MPIDYPYELIKKSQSVHLKTWPLGDGDWLAWWYRGVLKNRRAIDQPHVRVVFRKLIDGKPTCEIKEADVLLTALEQLKLGRVWRNGRCVYEVNLEEKTIHTDFTDGAWVYTSFRETNLYLKRSPFPQQIYPLNHEDDPTKLLELSTTNGGKLIIPCMVYFTCCYGASAEVKRILATYTEEDCQKKFFTPLDKPIPKDKWQIRRRRRLKKNDAVFLAHYYYDQYTRKISKRIHSQIQAYYDESQKTPSEIQVAPWFEGEVKIEAQGIPFDRGRSFLALQITGCSDPEGLPISCLVEKTVKSDTANSDDEKETVKIDLVTHPEEIDLTDDDAPNQGGSIADVSDSSFKILGEPRAVTFDGEPSSSDSKNIHFNDTESSEFSTGEPHGSDGDVGFGLLHNIHELESKGILQDMWEVLTRFKEKFPNRVQCVEHFTLATGFSESDELKLTKLEPFHEDEKFDSEICNWLFLDSSKRLKPRGVLIIRILIDNNYVYIVEIQRRMQKRKNINGYIEKKEEPLTGLVFTLSNQQRLKQWLRCLLKEIRLVKGVFSKIAGLCPGYARSFKHPSGNARICPGEASVRNALDKININI